MRSATVRAAIRRGCVCPICPARPRPELEGDLRDLRRLAGARLARDDHDLVVADRGADVRPPRADGQLLGVDDRRDVDGPADLGGAGASGGGARGVVASRGTPTRRALIRRALARRALARRALARRALAPAPARRRLAR